MWLRRGTEEQHRRYSLKTSDYAATNTDNAVTIVAWRLVAVAFSPFGSS